MSVVAQRLAVAASLLLGGACGQNSATGFASAAPLRQGTDLPAQFEPPTGFGRLSLTDTIPGNACLSPMHDPRTNTEIKMTRAANGQADYKVPDGRYGVGSGQLLRLDCNTGRPLGIVKE
jgi:hypothetical protein